MAKFKIKHTITKKEWNKKHKDFKSMIDGVPYIMMYDDKTGTHLVPVKIVDESVNEDSYDNNGLRNAFPWANKKELDTIYKWGTAFTRGGTQGIIKKYSKDKDFKPFIKNAAKNFFESVNEGSFSEIDIMAKAARNFNDFVKEFYKDFRDFPKDKDTLKWLKSLYAGRSAFESVNELDMNDPILVKLRALQMRKNKEAAKKIDTEKQNKNAIKIKALKKKRAEVMRDMEQEAEPEGGKIADRYGKLLNKIDTDIIKLGGNPMSEGMVKPKSGHTYYQLTKDFPIKYITGKYGMGLEVPGVLIKNKSGYIDGKKGAYLIDYFNALYYVDMKKKFASPVYSLRDQDKFSRGSITQVDMAPEHSDWKKYLKEVVNENDGVYFKSYTAAIEAARAAALKKGFEVEDDEMFTKVGMNSKRPSVGKTTRVSLELIKNGKPQRKMLHIQVYGMKNGYELNSYIN